MIDRNFNDVEKSKHQRSKVKRKLSESKNLRGLGAEPPAAGGQRGLGGGAPNAAAIFPDFSKKESIFKHALIYISA